MSRGPAEGPEGSGAAEDAAFRCLGCKRPLDEAHIAARMAAPPGQCPHCGHSVVLECAPGATARIAASIGEKVGTIELDPVTGKAQVVVQ